MRPIHLGTIRVGDRYHDFEPCNKFHVTRALCESLRRNRSPRAIDFKVQTQKPHQAVGIRRDTPCLCRMWYVWPWEGNLPAGYSGPTDAQGVPESPARGATGNEPIRKEVSESSGGSEAFNSKIMENFGP